MKQTQLTVTKGTVEITEYINASMKRLRKKLKVGAGGMTEREWYARLAEAYVACLQHVGNNLTVDE
jgi:hypothetical protein